MSKLEACSNRGRDESSCMLESRPITAEHESRARVSQKESIAGRAEGCSRVKRAPYGDIKSTRVYVSCTCEPFETSRPPISSSPLRSTTTPRDLLNDFFVLVPRIAETVKLCALAPT